jgi:ABC-type phosphate transport system substrate-binding protein
MKRQAILTAGLLAVLCSLRASGAENPAYKIVVNAANPESTITLEHLSALFLKNTPRWSNGTVVLPVDQSATAPIRVAFSRDVFGQDVLMIQSYWQGEISARRPGPPPVKATDEEVMAYVETNAGAIGYVSQAATLRPRLKLLKVTN